MLKSMLLETTMDSDGNPWSLVVRPDGSIKLIYLLEQIAALDAIEGKSLLNQPLDGAERLRRILSRLEIIGVKIDGAIRSHFMLSASWIDEHW